jgi:hypothetical protein
LREVTQKIAQKEAEITNLTEKLALIDSENEKLAGSELRSWLLLARILSAQKHFADAETIVDAALDQSGKWSQGDLLRTKARIQAAQEQFGDAVESYTLLLAINQLRAKSFSAGIYMKKGNKDDKSLEAETWYDLAGEKRREEKAMYDNAEDVEDEHLLGCDVDVGDL